MLAAVTPCLAERASGLEPVGGELIVPYFVRTMRELPPEEAERAAGHKPGAADRLNLSG
ncbi:hypothetical protein FRACA_2340007 [Frankia canadensis]|uniref:Uncharacterized protein n=1 Tax=Frankia canadensis TaxID=1836972 RepID=A0A2I2KRJ5_9ACTN|nr:hypothetical protein FRACA_2340007 [Frankia canadensis]SOU55581.1 hypothetical protein FRACA_2340007 [Frankia canadensis]